MFIPWLVTFTKWCLGIPPSISLEDGTIIQRQPNSRVNIIVGLGSGDPTSTSKFTMFIFRDIENPAELVVADTVRSTEWAGMVKVETCDQWILQNYDLFDGESYRLLRQILPYALK